MEPPEAAGLELSLRPFSNAVAAFEFMLPEAGVCIRVNRGSPMVGRSSEDRCRLFHGVSHPQGVRNCRLAGYGTHGR